MIVEFGRYIFMAFAFIALLAAASQPAAQIHGFLPSQIGDFVVDARAVGAVATAALFLGLLGDGAVRHMLILAGSHVMVSHAAAGAGSRLRRVRQGRAGKSN